MQKQYTRCMYTYFGTMWTRIAITDTHLDIDTGNDSMLLDDVAAEPSTDEDDDDDDDDEQDPFVDNLIGQLEELRSKVGCG